MLLHKELPPPKKKLPNNLKSTIVAVENNTISTYSIIDYTKFIFAICIVCIHANVLENQVIYPLLFRLAVPYFFIASGFFLGGKLFKSNYKTISQWKGTFNRLLIKLIIFEPFSIFLIAIQLIRQGNSISEIILQIVQHIVFYPYGALWYIQALIIAFAIIIPIYRKIRLSYILIIAFILYLFALICNNYYFFASHCGISDVVDIYIQLFISPRNGLFVGTLYVTIGLIIRKNEPFILQMQKYKIILLLIFSYIILLTEVFCIKGKESVDDGGLYLSYCIVIPLIFMLTISFKNAPVWNSKLFRNLSTSIYLVHRPILMLWISFSVNILGCRFTPVEAFVLTLATGILISLVGYKSYKIYKVLT